MGKQHEADRGRTLSFSGRWGKWMKAPVFVQKIWTHDTGVLLFRQTKGSQNKTKWDFSLLGGVKIGLASIYKPIYYRGKRGEGGGVPEYFIVRRGGISYSLFLGFRILRIHICQLSSRKGQRKRIKSIWALWSKAWGSLKVSKTLYSCIQVHFEK